MTGLDPERDAIVLLKLPLSSPIPQLNILAEGPVIAVHQSDKLLAPRWMNGILQHIRQVV